MDFFACGFRPADEVGPPGVYRKAISAYEIAPPASTFLSANPACYRNPRLRSEFPPMLKDRVDLTKLSEDEKNYSIEVGVILEWDSR